MEPVTHFLTGAAMGRSGLNRKAAYVTLAMVLAAEAPDIDIVWSLRGPTAMLGDHRGWTHTLIGAPVMATAVWGAVWLWHRWRSRKSPTKNAAPVHWGWLWLCALIADLSHIFLDYTNNYGVRPFAPFNTHWYAGNIVFIFEPLIFLALLVALLAPWLFGLADREIGVRRRPFAGRNWAIGALLFIVLLWGYRAAQHHRAVEDVLQQDWHGQQILRVSAEPYPITPWRWHCIVETPNAFITSTVDTLSDTVTSDAVSDKLYKPVETPAVMAAKRSRFGRVYMDWSQIPYVQDLGRVPLPTDPAMRVTLVSFRDLRFEFGLASAFFGTDASKAPLTALVYVDDSGQVVLVRMGNEQEK